MNNIVRLEAPYQGGGKEGGKERNGKVNEAGGRGESIFGGARPKPVSGAGKGWSRAKPKKSTKGLVGGRWVQTKNRERGERQGRGRGSPSSTRNWPETGGGCIKKKRWETHRPRRFEQGKMWEKEVAKWMGK